jgi:hypothetical protein
MKKNQNKFLKAVVAVVIFIISSIVTIVVGGAIIAISQKTGGGRNSFPFYLLPIPFYLPYLFCYSKWAKKIIWKN